jgi:hypothetical protein
MTPHCLLTVTDRVHESMISNFRRVLSVLYFLLSNSPVSEFYMPTFRNTLLHLRRQVGVNNFFPPTCLWIWKTVFRNVGIQNSDAGEFLPAYLPMNMEQTVFRNVRIQNSHAGEFLPAYLPMNMEQTVFRNVSIQNSHAGEFLHAYLPMNMEQTVFRNVGIQNSHAGEFLRTYLPMKMERSVPKRRHIQFRRRGITQKKAYKTPWSQVLQKKRPGALQSVRCQANI